MNWPEVNAYKKSVPAGTLFYFAIAYAQEQLGVAITTTLGLAGISRVIFNSPFEIYLSVQESSSSSTCTSVLSSIPADCHRSPCTLPAFIPLAKAMAFSVQPLRAKPK